MKNKMQDVAKLLGLELGEEFKIIRTKGKFVLSSTGLKEIDVVSSFFGKVNSNLLEDLLIEPSLIIKSRKLNNEEIEELESIPRKFDWIARDKDNSLHVYKTEPKKNEFSDSWLTEDMYQEWTASYCKLKMITWEDEEAYCIDELLEEGEYL